jgi:hypothetical protein
VSTDRNDEADDFDGQSTENESGTRRGARKEHERGDGEKESGWHDDQSGELHGLSLIHKTGFHKTGLHKTGVRKAWIKRTFGISGYGWELTPID